MAILSSQECSLLIGLKDWAVPIFSAIIGGVLALVGAIWAVREAAKGLENSEIRRQRIDCVSNLVGLRYTITSANISNEDRSSLLFELNRITILWSDNSAVLMRMREFYSNRTNEGFMRLVRAMAQTTALNVENISDADLGNVFLRA